MIRAVFFDAVGTLLHPEPPAADVYFQIGRRCGSLLGRDAIEARFADAFQAQERMDAELGHRTSEERELRRWRDIVAAVLDDVADPAACFATLYEHFGRPEAWRCDPAAADLLDSLRDAGLALGLASNFDGRLRGVVRGLTALRHVARLVISSEVGWKKPATGFFEAVCAVSKLGSEAVLFVGDDFSNDYRAARAAGMQAVLLDPGARYRDSGAARIETLSELRRTDFRSL